MTPALSDYLDGPSCPLDQFIVTKRMALGREMRTKIRIYLDQKYWIYFRDVVAGKPQNPVHDRIFDTLKDLVSSGKVICPASFQVLLETFKQRDIESRKATARVIDQLSRGVAIAPFVERQQTEILQATRKVVTGSADLDVIGTLAWTSIGFVAGVVIPGNTPLNVATELAGQKAFFDAISSLSLEAMISHYDLDEMPVDLDDVQRMDKLTRESRAHRDEITDFASAVGIEVTGVLEEHLAEFRSAAAYVASLPAAPRYIENLVAGQVRSRILDGSWATVLPTLYIASAIHAALRFLNRKFRKGDSYDIPHASAALPNCDFFFTEKKLGNLITRSPLKLDATFGCRVLWNDDDILMALNELAA